MDFKYIIIRASSALLLLSGPLFTACDDDDPDAFITVSKQEIEVEYNGLTANGETVNFDLGSNHAWQATYVEEWIHPTHTEGDRGRTRIFLAIDENDTGKDREGYVIFEGGGSRRTVAVTQKLKIDALMVSPGKLTVVRSGLLETGEKASVYISANSDWTIEPSGDSGWITPSKTSGKAGEEDVELTIAQNTTGAVRTGTFVVVAGSKRATVTVTQNLEGLKVSATSFRVNKFGFADEERTPLTFTVTAAEAWTSTADGWLTLSPASGDAGETEVTLTVGENGTGALRSGEVKIVTAQTGLEETVSVSQNAKDNLFEDDGQQVGHVYYNEPFDWCKPFNKDDQVGSDGVKTSTLPIYGTTEDRKEGNAAFVKSGLKDYNPDGECMYLASDYLKMGRGGNQTGVILPALDAVAEGYCTDVELTFEICPNIGGSKIPDEVTVSVEIVEGPGTIGGEAKLSDPITPEGKYVWTPVSMKLYGITADTRIVIRSTQQGQNGYFRWFLDDIKMTKIAAE